MDGIETSLACCMLFADQTKTSKLRLILGHGPFFLFIQARYFFWKLVIRNRLFFSIEPKCDNWVSLIYVFIHQIVSVTNPIRVNLAKFWFYWKKKSQ